MTESVNEKESVYGTHIKIMRGEVIVPIDRNCGLLYIHPFLLRWIKSVVRYNRPIEHPFSSRSTTTSVYSNTLLLATLFSFSLTIIITSDFFF